MGRSCRSALVGALLGGLLGPVGVSVGRAAAPSFDCAKAAAWAETAVCTHDNLAALDASLAAAYGRLHGRMSGAEADGLRTAQRTWLKHRYSCQKAAKPLECVEAAYRDRLAVLDGQLAKAGPTSPPAGKPAQPQATAPEPQVPAPQAQPPRKPSTDWARLLATFLPAIDACLAVTPARPAIVTLAWPEPTGAIGVRTRGTDQRRWECTVRGDGSNVEQLAPVASEETKPGEGVPLFTRAPQQPPEGKCYDHERVVGKDGHLLGWLSFQVC